MACGPNIEAMGSALVRTLRHLKAVARQNRALVVASVPLYLYSGSGATEARMVSTADCVLRVTALAEDAPLLRLIANPLHCAALLKVVKLPSLGALATHVQGDGLHVVRHRRRHVQIGQVVLDPDREGGDGEGEGGGRAGGSGGVVAALCAGPVGTKSSLDF